MPEDGYGWEKLFSERMCRHFREDFGIATRVARYHNVYGPHGTYDGGREKAPAAICRKVIAAKLSGSTRSRSGATASRHAASCISTTASRARSALAESDIIEPLNIGSDELVTINQLVDIVEEIAGVTLKRSLQARCPQGRARPQQRQHADQEADELGALRPPRGRHGEDLQVDLRRDDLGENLGRQHRATRCSGALSPSGTFHALPQRVGSWRPPSLARCAAPKLPYSTRGLNQVAEENVSTRNRACCGRRSYNLIPG